MPDPADLFPGFTAASQATAAGRIFALTGGRGPPLVLLHGFPESLAMWHAIAPGLADQFTIVVMDLRGYGWSSAPRSQAGEAYAKRCMAEDVVALMEGLGHARFTLAGHDRGARVGYRLALDQPGRLERLVLLDIVPTVEVWRRIEAGSATSPHWPRLAAAAPAPEEEIGRDPDAYFSGLMAKWTKAGSLAAFDQRALGFYRDAWGDRSRIHAMCEDYRAGATLDRAADEADLAAGKTVPCPVHVLASTAYLQAHDAEPALAVWQRTFAPQATGDVLDCGHFLAEEAPAETLAILRRVLGAGGWVTTPTIGLALGGGGARGLAHIVVLDAFDALGLRPTIMAGTSMGALIGTAYAAGMSARDIRAHLLQKLRNRRLVLGHLLEARVGRFADILTRGVVNPVLVDVEDALPRFWPGAIPATFEDLTIPMLVVATDLDAREAVVLRAGPLAGALAASAAVPGLVRPVPHGGRLLIDGGAVNPLPYDLLFGAADLVIACDVSGGRAEALETDPPVLAVMLSAAQVMQSALTGRMLRAQPPDLLLRPAVERFRLLDFFYASRILEAADACAEAIKRDIAALINKGSTA